MRIEDLDEFQGLTPQMVREWLREQGFDMRIGGLLHAGRYLAEWEPIESAWLSTEVSLYAVAQYRNQSVQSLLREINPRMRKGMPSQSALAASSHWLVLDNETQEIALYRSNGRRLHVARAPFELMPDFGDFVSYWPCDEHGNKVRWPTDAQGNML